MANYYASARSNYFRVKDRAAFDAAIARLADLTIVEGRDDNAGRVALLCDGGDQGGWPGWTMDETGEGEDTEVDVPELVAEHLDEGEVAVFMEAGAEKLRYVCGYATAINSAGERRDVSLDSIYELAKELGNATQATY